MAAETETEIERERERDDLTLTGRDWQHAVSGREVLIALQTIKPMIACSTAWLLHSVTVSATLAYADRWTDGRTDGHCATVP